MVGLDRAFAHELHGIAGAGLQVADHRRDLVGGALHALGQVAHLVGDHREAAAHLAGARRLDGRVEGQQVGLFGDAVDDVDHAADHLAVLGQALDHLGGLLHAHRQAGDGLAGAADHLLADSAQAVGLGGLVAGVGGVLGDVVDGRRHLVDRRGRLVGLALLAEHAAAHLVHAAGQALGAVVEVGGGLGDDADDALVAALHGVEGAGHLADLVLAVDPRPGGQVAAAFGVQHGVLELVEVAEDEADQQLRGAEQRQHQHQHGQGVGAGALLEQLPQARRTRQHRQLLAVAARADPGAKQRRLAPHPIAVQLDPAVPTGQGGGLRGGQRRALAGLQAQHVLRRWQLPRPGGQQLGAGLGGGAGFVEAAVLFLLHGVQHQQQGGGEGHQVDGPEFVFEGEVSYPFTHGRVLVGRLSGSWPHSGRALGQPS
ncbi:hypothetical protein D9M69_412890 [compost metagenome]